LDRKFNKDSENVLKTVIFSLQVGLKSNFVSDCQTALKSCKNQDLEMFSKFRKYTIQNVFLRFMIVILTVAKPW